MHAKTTLLSVSLSLIAACNDDVVTKFNSNNQGKLSPPKSEDLESSYVFEFELAEAESQTLAIDTGFALVEQEFSTKQLPRSKQILTQSSRPIIDKSFTQGHGGDTNFESFPVTEAGLFDLLILIDDSSSMADYQQRLSTTLPSILRYISNTNWQIAVATTSSSCLVRTSSGNLSITRQQYDADPGATAEEFQRLIQIGEGGNPVERGIEMLTKALKGDCAGSSWIRADSTRAALLLSDEENCGSAVNEGCPESPARFAQHFFDEAPQNITVSALLLLEEPPAYDFNDPDDPYRACRNSGGYDESPNPAEYVSIVERTGGLLGDICRSDYSQLLDQLSLDVSKKINFQYELSYEPVAESLEVSLDGRQLANFSVSGNILSVNEPLEIGMQSIEVSYKHTPVQKKRSFPLEQRADASSIRVNVNSKLLNQNEFSFDRLTNEVVLQEMPQDRAKISINFRPDTKLARKFQIAPVDLIEESLEVRVNGQKMSASFFADSLEVELEQAPQDGQKIEISYEKPGDKTLDYPVAVEGDIEKIELFDAKTMQAVGFQLEGNRLILSTEDVWAGRKILARYDRAFREDQLNFELNLPENVDFSSISTQSDAGLCPPKFSKSKIRLECQDDTPSEILVSYKTSADYTNVFLVAVDSYRPKNYFVTIDSKPYEDFYVFEDQLIILPEDLKAGSRVRIEVQLED